MPNKDKTIAPKASQTTEKEIKHVATLDLTGMKAEDLAKVETISHVATLIVPESLMGVLADVKLEHVASTIPVPDGKQVNVRNMNGPIQMGGDSLVSDDDCLQLLVVNGPLIFMTPVTESRDVQLVVNGPVFAPQGSENALGAAIRQLNGPMDFYHTDGDIKVHSGQAKLNGAVLANANGSPEDILLIAGQLLVNSQVESVGFKQIYIAGQALIPKEAEELLSPYLQVFGQIVWYSGTPRSFDGNESFNAAFFDYLPEPITLILNGIIKFDADITPELLKEKVTEIILNGIIEAPAHLVPLIQVLTTEKNGMINVADDESADEDAEE
ncbi:MAG: hypothetical protein AAF702_28395 [Chloroflexota bacterium]